MDNKNKRLSILSDLEEFAFYGLPDFDDAQRKQYFKLEPQEWELVETCSSLCAKVYHAIQIGYFKAKNTFFKFSLQKIPQHDIHFILTRYFQNQALSVFSITTRYPSLFRDVGKRLKNKGISGIF